MLKRLKSRAPFGAAGVRRWSRAGAGSGAPGIGKGVAATTACRGELKFDFRLKVSEGDEGMVSL